MSRPDPSRSTAILIGTSTHQLPTMLADLPPVRTNVSELARLITVEPVGLVDADRCVQLIDISTSHEAGLAIHEHCEGAEDLLLVYFAGHGLLDDKGELFLAL